MKHDCVPEEDMAAKHKDKDKDKDLCIGPH